MARTTLILDDACMRKLRQLAHDNQRTLTDLVNELLAEGVRSRTKRVKREPLSIPSFSMGTARIDLADRDALEDAMS